MKGIVTLGVGARWFGFRKDSFMKGIVMKGVSQKNPKQPTQTTNQPLADFNKTPKNDGGR